MICQQPLNEAQFRVSFRLKGNFLRDTIPKPRPKPVARLNKEQQDKVLEDNDVFYTSLNINLKEESI